MNKNHVFNLFKKVLKVCCVSMFYKHYILAVSHLTFTNMCSFKPLLVHKAHVKCSFVFQWDIQIKKQVFLGIISISLKCGFIVYVHRTEVWLLLCRMPDMFSHQTRNQFLNQIAHQKIHKVQYLEVVTVMLTSVLFITQ